MEEEINGGGTRGDGGIKERKTEEKRKGEGRQGGEKSERTDEWRRGKRRWRNKREQEKEERGWRGIN